MKSMRENYIKRASYSWCEIGGGSSGEFPMRMKERAVSSSPANMNLSGPPNRSVARPTKGAATAYTADSSRYIMHTPSVDTPSCGEDMGGYHEKGEGCK